MTEEQRKKHFENVCDECEKCNYFIDNDETGYYECYEVSGVVESGNTQLVFLVRKECGKEMLITLDTRKAKISLELLDKCEKL